MSRALYYKKYIFILSTVAALTLLFGVVSHYHRNNTYDVNVLDLVEEEEENFNLNSNKTKNSEDTPTLNFTLQGEVSGISNSLNRPKVKVRISTKNSNGESLQKVIGLDYNNRFLLEVGEINRGEVVVVSLESPDYIFFPVHKNIKVQKSIETVTFKAEIKELSSNTLLLSGKIIAPGNSTGLVYLIGWPVNGNSRVKKFTSVTSDGEFKFKDLESGTYLILPEIDNVVLMPESRQVDLINKDIKVNFIGTKNLF